MPLDMSCWLSLCGDVACQTNMKHELEDLQNRSRDTMTFGSCTVWKTILESSYPFDTAWATVTIAVTSEV